MKKLLIVFIIILFAETLPAQTSAEWLSQKKTQKKYLVQQIAALHVYAGYLSKGYTIVKGGINAIQNIKHGDLNLHADHYASSLSVNPKIKRYSKVADILSMELSIAKQTGSAIKRFINSNQFTSEEVGYLKNVCNNIITACGNNLDGLSKLITGDYLQMKDDERIQGIDNIYADMQDIKMFTTSFCNNAAGVSIQRANEENEIIVSKKLNEVK